MAAKSLDNFCPCHTPSLEGNEDDDDGGDEKKVKRVKVATVQVFVHFVSLDLMHT